MHGRTLLALALGLLAAGLTTSGTGIAHNHTGIISSGALLALLAFLPYNAHILRQAHRAHDDDLATAHAEGYRLALQHVAAGLLDPMPTSPPDGGHPTTGHTAPRATVHYLRSATITAALPAQRKAQ